MSSYDVAYTVGLCGPHNPGGSGGWGVVLQDSEGFLMQQFFGQVNASQELTNNVMEYVAVGKALQAYALLKRKDGLIVKTSSQLVVMQMKGLWRGKKGSYLAVQQAVSSVRDNCGYLIQWEWVSQGANVAFSLADKALTEMI